MIKKILVIVLLGCGVTLSGASQGSSSSAATSSSSSSSAGLLSSAVRDEQVSGASSSTAGLSSSSSASMVIAADAGVAKSAAADAAANGSADNFEEKIFYVPFVGMQGKDYNQRLFDDADEYVVSNVQHIMKWVANNLDKLRIHGSDQLQCDDSIKVVIKISKPDNNPYAHTINSFFIAGKSKTEVLGQVASLISEHETDKGNKKRAALVEGYIRAAMTPAQKVAAATAGKKKKEEEEAKKKAAGVQVSGTPNAVASSASSSSSSSSASVGSTSSSSSSSQTSQQQSSAACAAAAATAASAAAKK